MWESAPAAVFIEDVEALDTARAQPGGAGHRAATDDPSSQGWGGPEPTFHYKSDRRGEKGDATGSRKGDTKDDRAADQKGQRGDRGGWRQSGWDSWSSWQRRIELERRRMEF